jgi:molybdate transport system substrate-binding protein
MLRKTFASFAVALGLLATACSQQQEKAEPLVVLAAASLQEALNAEADAWAAQGHPRPTLSFAASSALARQVESGAPADLFLSADEKWMDTVEKDGALKAGSRRDLLTNSIVLIAPKASTASVDLTNAVSLDAALGKGRLAMADPDAVPAGKYGKAALEHLKLWDKLASKVARADNVRSALALVESGEAPLGIVYTTDAAASKSVRVLATFPEDSHPPIRYPVAVLTASKNTQADGFEQFLASEQGQAIFAKYGFGTAK